jgi:mRNA interferase RelE/StbE
VYETRSFLEGLKGLPFPYSEKVHSKLKNHVYPQIKHQPYFGLNIKKLRDWKPDTWRYRIGSWRVFYEVEEKEHIIFMTAIDLRRDAYS